MTRFRMLKLLTLVLAGALFSGAAQETDFTKSFTVNGGGTLRLDVRGESVQISTADGRTVTVEVKDLPERDKDKLRVEQSGNDVIVTYKPPRRRDADTRFFITVPRAYNVQAEYAGGRFEVGDKLEGTLDLKTGGGNVDLQEITGNVVITSGGGSIDALKLGSDAKLTTGGGNMEIKTVLGSADVKSGGGNIRLENVGKDLHLTTGGGNVRLGPVGGRAEIETGGGTVEVGSVTAGLSMRSGGGNLSADGAKGRTTVSSGGGNVELRSLTGSVGVKTGGGNVSIDLRPEGAEGSEVESRGGDIAFRLPEDTKATVEVTVNIRNRRPKRQQVVSDFKAEKYEKDEDGNVEALYLLNGGGTKIRLETTDGEVRLLKLR